ncbi:hypothetical protein ABPG72_014561 [Tetrahymena utriculariae]
MSNSSNSIQEIQENQIHQALRTCDLAEVKKAIHIQKSRINEKDVKLGWAPLYKAVLYGDIQIVEFLLQNGADPNVKNKLEDTPLHLCIENNYFEIFSNLLQYKADPNIKGPEGLSPLHIACFHQKEQFILKLLAFGADIDIKTSIGITPLHIAAESNNPKIIRILLDRNPKINSMDQDGKTAIDYCSDKNCRDILEEYESNCMNPLNESIISCKSEVSQNTKVDTSNISTFSNKSKKLNLINTTQLRQNWDLKIQGLKQNINEVKDLKLEVSKTLEEHKLKETQRKKVLSEIKNENDKQQYQNYDLNDKENCSSIINFLVNDNTQQLYLDVDNSHNQKPFLSSNYELPSKQVSQDLKKDQYQEKYANYQNDLKAQQNQSQDNQYLDQSNEDVIKYQIKESKTISMWLREINLECLLQNFLDNNVYDNQSLLKFLNNSNNWDKLLVTLFGVDKFGHRLRIITKLHEDCGLEKRNGVFSLKYNLGGIELPTVQAWLQSLNLDLYIDLFLLAGFDDLESMMFQMTTNSPITDDMLFKEVGICDHNSRKKILDSLSRDSHNAQIVAVPKGFCGGFNFETSSNPNKCENKCSIF